MTVRHAWPSYREPWSSDVKAVDVDGISQDDLVDVESRRIRLDGRDTWSTAALSFTCATEQAAPSDVTDLRGYVLVSSTRTGLRMPVGLTDVRQSPSAATLDLRRRDVAGTVKVRAEIVGTHKGRTRLVGRSDEWSVIVDKGDAPLPPGAPPFESKWLDFSSADAPPVLRAYSKAYVHMDLSGERPRLLLNSGIEGFQQLLTASRPQLERRRHKELLGVQIARYSVASILRDAARQIELEEEAAPPAGALHRQVCEAVAEHLAAVPSAQEFYKCLHETGRQGGPAYTLLWSEIDTALDGLVGVPDTLAGVVKEIKHA